MAEKLFSVKELAEAEGVSRYCMAGRIRSLRVEPSGYRWEKNHFVGLYPRTIMDEWRERSRCSGWYALQTVVGWIKKGTGITECFLDASGWETRMSDGRRQWLIPQDMRDAEKIRAAFEKWKRSTYYMPSTRSGRWIQLCADKTVRDMVLQERKHRKLVGRTVTVKPKKGKPVSGRLEYCNMIGLSVIVNGETVEYRMNQVEAVEAT